MTVLPCPVTVAPPASGSLTSSPGPVMTPGSQGTSLLPAFSLIGLIPISYESVIQVLYAVIYLTNMNSLNPLSGLPKWR